MRLAIAFLLLFLVTLATDSWATVWRVKPDSTGTVINIQAGIDSCKFRDTVLVLRGVYRGDGNRQLDFKGKPILVIAESRYDTTVTDSSVIDCESSFIEESYHWGFHFHSGESESSILDGLVLLNGVRPYVEGLETRGGGIRCDSSSSPIIRFTRIRHCSACGGGGAIYCNESSPIISNNEISDNQGGCPGPGGGGILCVHASPVISNNRILGNEAYRFGAGISCDSCASVTIRDNIIRDNFGFSHGSAGAGIYLTSCNAAIDGNSIENNSCSDNLDPPGGVYAHACSLTVTNNSISYNGGRYGPAAMLCDSSVVTLTGNTFEGNDGGPLGFHASQVVMKGNIIQNNLGSPYYAYPMVAFTNSLTSDIRDNIISSNEGQHLRISVLVYDGASETRISGNTITNNHGGSPLEVDGAAVNCSSSSPEISNNLIAGNDAAGIVCTGGAPRIMNNTIFGGVDTSGAAIDIDTPSAAIVTCNIVAGGKGAGISAKGSLSTIECNDVFDNARGNYVGVPDQTGLNGNISAHPLFCNASGGDYSLADNSPCLSGNHPGGGGCGLMGAFGQGCTVIATLLQDFRAEVMAPAIVLRWRLSEASTRMDFFVLRAEAASTDFAELADAVIERDGLSFAFRDTGCKPGTAYRYQVGVSDEAGRRVLFETGAVTTPAAKLALSQNYPNPFNPSTSISYYLPSKARVAIEIYDASGGLVKRLLNEERESGAHTIAWNGLDDRGTQVASGVYFSRLKVGKEVIARKMVLLR
jgi:hypothetical protein